MAFNKIIERHFQFLKHAERNMQYDERNKDEEFRRSNGFGWLLRAGERGKIEFPDAGQERIQWRHPMYGDLDILKRGADRTI